MTLTLTASEQRTLSAASATFLAPQDFPTVDCWRRRCNHTTRALLSADCASFMLPTGGEVHLFSDEWPPAIPNAYPDRVATLDREHGFWRRQVDAGAWARRRLFTPAMYASSYYRDFVEPARAFDAIGMTVECATGSGLASLLFHHTSRRGPRFGDRALAMLGLLLPSFRSGVRAQQLMRNSAAGLARLVDTVPTALVLVRRNGTIVHTNPIARALLQGSEGARRHAAIQRVSAAVFTARSDGSLHISSAGAGATLEACDLAIDFTFAGPELHALGAEGVVLLRERARRIDAVTTVSDGELTERFRLTRQQLRVARLLGEGLSNREMAEALGVSVHTAKRHTESVMAKLGVASRSRVPAALQAR